VPAFGSELKCRNSLFLSRGALPGASQPMSQGTSTVPPLFSRTHAASGKSPPGLDPAPSPANRPFLTRRRALETFGGIARAKNTRLRSRLHEALFGREP